MLRLIAIGMVLCLVASCKKKEEPPPETPPSTPPIITGDTSCRDLPSPPEGYQWRDSIPEPEHSVLAFVNNPLQNDAVIAVLSGGLPGSFHLVNVNLVSGEVVFLDHIDKYLPSINAEGWILYGGPDNNIHKIKADGTGHQQLTQLKNAHNPVWDRTGKKFFYISDAIGTLPARLVLADAEGQGVGNWPERETYIAAFHKNNRVLVQEHNGSQVTLYLRDLDSNSRQPVLSAPFDQVNGDTPFRNLLVDENDASVFWTNGAGVFRHHFATGVTDTVLKNCESVIYDRPLAGGPGEITLSKHTIGVLKPLHLIHRYKGIEYNYQLKNAREVNIF